MNLWQALNLAKWLPHCIGEVIECCTSYYVLALLLADLKSGEFLHVKIRQITKLKPSPKFPAIQYILGLWTGVEISKGIDCCQLPYGRKYWRSLNLRRFNGFKFGSMVRYCHTYMHVGKTWWILIWWLKDIPPKSQI